MAKPTSRDDYGNPLPQRSYAEFLQGLRDDLESGIMAMVRLVAEPYALCIRAADWNGLHALSPALLRGWGHRITRADIAYDTQTPKGVIQLVNPSWDVKAERPLPDSVLGAIGGRVPVDRHGGAEDEAVVECARSTYEDTGLYEDDVASTVEVGEFVLRRGEPSAAEQHIEAAIAVLSGVAAGRAPGVIQCRDAARAIRGLMGLKKHLVRVRLKHGE